MKRKAIQLANNTLVVSLPAGWVRQNNIEKGAELEVDIKEKKIIVSKDAKQAEELKKIEIDIDGMSVSLVWNYLNSIYRAGYQEIDINFSEKNIRNIKTGKEEKTLEVISKITDKMVGMEIISHSKNSCKIKEVSQLKTEEYSNVLNRIFLSLIVMANDILEAIKKKDKESLENIYTYSETNINKLSDYCMKILNSRGLEDFKKSNSNYLTIFILEEVGDLYSEIARNMAESQKKISPEIISIFEEINALLELSKKLFLNQKKETYINFHEERNRVKNKIKKAEESCGKNDGLVLFLLTGITDKLMECGNCKAMQENFG
jgi:phosphate uptake regulator